MRGPSLFSQLKSILALPTMVLLVIPYILLNYIPSFLWQPIWVVHIEFDKILSFFLLLVGFSIFLQSIILFVKIGKGTLAPWDPTKKLVVKSLYRYVRNPMILGVLIILLAETLYFRSLNIFLWTFLFFLINHFYFILKEEPDLMKRFGDEYLEYKMNVPRWIPKISGWKPEDM